MDDMAIIVISADGQFMSSKPLISDEDFNELWRKHSHIPFGYMDISRRIESLVRKRLAERLRAERDAYKPDSIAYARIEQAALIVEDSDER